MIKLLQGNNLDLLKDLPDNSIDAIVTDPPYGLSFMGKKWDYDVPSVEIWTECLRVLKPGGHLLAFAGTRTQHRMAVRIEDAGFEIRDMIAWVYGSGFPKSLNIGKAVDKLQGNEREEFINKNGSATGSIVTTGTGSLKREFVDSKGTSEWEGWGTALKPALEPITVARKPLSEKTVAENVLKWGTGGIEIDGCRIETSEKSQSKGAKLTSNTYGKINVPFEENKYHQSLGRFPANLIHDGSEEVLAGFPETKSGECKESYKTTTSKYGANNIYSYSTTPNRMMNFPANQGSASRFFYCAKASPSERNEGLEGFDYQKQTHDFGTKLGTPRNERVHTPTQNHHPTVKPIKLMEYLVKLITPKGGTVLDLFKGNGSTGIAAVRNDFNFVGMELDADYFNIASARIAHAEHNLQRDLFNEIKENNIHGNNN